MIPRRLPMLRAIVKLALLSATLGSLVASHAVAAPDSKAPTPEQAAPSKPAAKPEPWAVKCNQAAGQTQRCSMLQNLVVKRGESTRRLLSVLVQREPRSNGMLLLLGLPHGLYLPAGVQYVVDRGQVRKVAIQTTDANGAYAGTKLTPELLLDLKRGKTLTVSMVAATRKPLTIAVTLAGFTAAYDKLIATTE